MYVFMTSYRTSVKFSMEYFDSTLFVNEVCNLKSIDSSLQQCAFEATVRTNVSCKENVERWVADFSERSGTGWIVRKTYPSLQRLELRQI